MPVRREHAAGTGGPRVTAGNGRPSSLLPSSTEQTAGPSDQPEPPSL